MKVAYIFGAFPVPSQTFAISDLAALSTLGVAVEVFTLSPRRSDPLLRLEKFDWPVRRPRLISAIAPVRSVVALRRFFWGIRFIAGRIFSRPREALVALLSLPRAVEIAEIVDCEEFDVVHAFWGNYPVLPLLLMSSVSNGRKPILSMFLGAYDLVGAGFLARGGLQVANLAFTHSEENIAVLREMGLSGEAFKVVHRGIPLELANSVRPDRVAGKIVTVGSLEKPKNIDGVIKVVAEINRRGYVAFLEIFGKGPERENLERTVAQLGISHQVTFHGHKSREEVFESLSSADVFLFLSKKPSERLPNAVKEAMYAGCAVIASQSVGIRELIPTPEYGHIVDPDNYQEILSALELCLSEDQKSRAERALRSRTLIEERFSSKASMMRYYEAWSEFDVT